MAHAGLAVTAAAACTAAPPSEDWASAYVQERLFRNIAATQGQNSDDIMPVRARDGALKFISPSRAMALVEGRGCSRGQGDDYVGAYGDTVLPSLAALGFSAATVRPELFVGTTFEGKAHGDDRECHMDMPFLISDVPENLFLAPENEYEVMRKKDAARLQGVLTAAALQKIQAFKNMAFQ